MGGYPQALLKVVNLQGMLNFHRNFGRSKRIKSRGRIVGGLLEHAWNYMCIELKQKQRWPEAIEKSDIGYPFSRMSQSCQLAVVISAITSYHQGNCGHRHKSNELGQHPKSNRRLGNIK